MTTFADRSTYYLFQASSPHHLPQSGHFLLNFSPLKYLFIRANINLLGRHSHHILPLNFHVILAFLVSMQSEKFEIILSSCCAKGNHRCMGLGSATLTLLPHDSRKIIKDDRKLLSLCLPVSLDIFVVYFTPRVCTIYIVLILKHSTALMNHKIHSSHNLYMLYTYHRFTASIYIQLSTAAHLSILCR